jgi:hypothetical protein
MGWDRASCKHAAKYCEENIWHLAGDAGIEMDEAFAVFVTNPAKTCALWCQQAAESPEDPVVWDYHVVLIDTSGGSVRVFDLDSRLDFPEAFRTYATRTFLSALALPEEFHPRFRVVAARRFRETFSSDRAHMKKPDGGWHAPPPEWPPIAAGKPGFTLVDALNLDDDKTGEVVDLEGLIRRFGS